MVYLISINYNKLLSVDPAICESYSCFISGIGQWKSKGKQSMTTKIQMKEIN